MNEKKNCGNKQQSNISISPRLKSVSRLNCKRILFKYSTDYTSELTRKRIPRIIYPFLSILHKYTQMKYLEIFKKEKTRLTEKGMNEISTLTQH